MEKYIKVWNFQSLFISTILCKVWSESIRTKQKYTFSSSFFAVNFYAFNFELEEVWGHFWIAHFKGYLKIPSNFF